ncbi:hypothetical protein [uncultured Mediterranean phage uvMED]|nr:hypothetical protein [uncultured Mediterranean phage uvMED]
MDNTLLSNFKWYRRFRGGYWVFYFFGWAKVDKKTYKNEMNFRQVQNFNYFDQFENYAENKKWISVKDRLPDKSMDVTVKCEGNALINKYEQDIEVYVCPEYGFVEWQNNGDAFLPTVTHWKERD